MSDKLLPCPFCGETPDVNGPHTFQDSQGTKWGSVVCCCTGPEVRTGYGPVEEWKADAIEAWNRRAASPLPQGDIEPLVAELLAAKKSDGYDAWVDDPLTTKAGETIRSLGESVAALTAHLAYAIEALEWIAEHKSGDVCGIIARSTLSRLTAEQKGGDE